MAGSQQSFDSVLTRFDNGRALLLTWGDYAPSNALIKTAALAAFITSVENANILTADKEQNVKDARDARGPLVFQIKDTNPECFELRIKGIRNYISGENLSKSAVKTLDGILKKIKPQYPKKVAGAARGAGKSPMEKSFNAAVGYGRTVINIITRLGIAYTPPDNNLTLANITALVTSIVDGNKAVQEALDDYGTANRARLALYAGKDGLQQRRTAILGYLSSFAGMKKSNHYKDYNAATK